MTYRLIYASPTLHDVAVLPNPCYPFEAVVFEATRLAGALGVDVLIQTQSDDGWSQTATAHPSGLVKGVSMEAVA